jgi:hypothetical protein
MSGNLGSSADALHHKSAAMKNGAALTMVNSSIRYACAVVAIGTLAATPSAAQPNKTPGGPGITVPLTMGIGTLTETGRPVSQQSATGAPVVPLPPAAPITLEIGTLTETGRPATGAPKPKN